MLILALGLGADEATALGFGKVVAAPILGQALSFAIRLRLDPGDSIEAKCIKAEVSLGDRVLADALVRTGLETTPSTGERQVRVTTTVPVDEPVVNVNLHLGCPASLSRSFVVFADPPGHAAVASGGRAPEEAWVPDRSESAVGPIVSAVPPAPAAAARKLAAQRNRKRRPEPAALDRPSRTEAAASPRTATQRSGGVPRARAPAAAKPSRGPVLRLDPVDADALISPSLQLATSLSQVPEPAASGAVPRFVDPERVDQGRLKAMEAALLQLRSDSQATEKALGEMQLRVRAAEARQYANPLVYLLVALCAGLATGLAAMVWLRRRDRRAAVWWTPPVEASPPPAPLADETPALLQRQEPTPEPAPRPADRMPMFSPPPSSAPAPHSADQDAGGPEPRRPMSAEELIDLEQQAEFFVVLGQDDAAIDLLMGHVRSTGGVSPLPYLKLLEIYRRRGEREAYDRIRERFNRRFNAYAPEWDVDPEQGLSLDGYPEVMERLQKAWESHSQAMDLLDASLFRRDAGPTFDVPAYRELLFLYGMARDLAEHDVVPDGVDLLLPLNEEPASTMTSVHASPPAPTPSLEKFSLDLDVSSDPPPRLSLEDRVFKRSSR